MMTCREVYGFLDEYLDGGLDVLTRQNFERHLERCVSCRNYLSTYRSTIRVAHHSEVAESLNDTGAPADLIKAILASRTASFVKQPSK